MKIDGKDYKLKYSLRSFFVFEQIAGHSFSFGLLIDEYLLFYSMLIANNEEFKMEYKDFINYCEADVSMFSEFKAYVINEIKLQYQLMGIGQDSEKKKTESN